MTNGQLTFDGRVVAGVFFDIPGFGKVRMELDADAPKPKTGDRVYDGTTQWVIVDERFGEKFNDDGYGIEEPNMVYVCKGVKPSLNLEGLRLREDIDADWTQKVSATG